MELLSWMRWRLVSSVWPDLAKFRKRLQVFGTFLTVYFLFGKMLNLRWQFCAIIGLMFIFVNGKILKNNLTIGFISQSGKLLVLWNGKPIETVHEGQKLNLFDNCDNTIHHLLLIKSSIENLWVVEKSAKSGDSKIPTSMLTMLPLSNNGFDVHQCPEFSLDDWFSGYVVKYWLTLLVEVSLYSWPPYFRVWIQLLCLCEIMWNQTSETSTYKVNEFSLMRHSHGHSMFLLVYRK